MDANFQTNWKAAGKAELLRGAYHFFRPNGATAEEQMKKFLTAFNGLEFGPCDLPPVLDIEALGSERNNTDRVKSVQEWLEIAERKFRLRPLIYGGRYGIPGGLEQYPLW